MTKQIFETLSDKKLFLSLLEPRRFCTASIWGRLPGTTCASLHNRPGGPDLLVDDETPSECLSFILKLY